MLDILPIRGGKANAIKYIVGQYGLTNDSVVALGDDVNDLGMMQLASIPVCPGNAIQSVKDIVSPKGYVSPLEQHAGTVDILKYVANLPWDY